MKKDGRQPEKAKFEKTQWTVGYILDALAKFDRTATVEVFHVHPGADETLDMLHGEEFSLYVGEKEIRLNP